jgi:hypothetical protein
MIVDSFKHPQTTSVTSGGKVRRRTRGVPAAALYLDGLGVQPEDIEAIVVTHFHTDHYEGLLQLHSQYTRAKLFVTSAVQHHKFRAVFGVGGSLALREVGAALTQAHDRRFGPNGGLVQVSRDHSLVHRTAENLHVRALAPSPDAAIEAAIEITQVIENNGDSASVRQMLRDDNRTSIALHVQACGQVAILCGDVVNNPPQFGWAAIVEHDQHQDLPAAEIVKVSHHGSKQADYADFWEKMVGRGSPMLVAPFWSSKIPMTRDQRRLTNRGELWQTNPSSPQLTTEWTITEKQPARTGIVQARRRHDGDWDIRVDDPAHRVRPPA